MPDPVDARRRWWGVFFLTAAAGLVIWGQTVFREYLVGLWFILYWSMCFVLTAFAVLTALLDVRALRRQHRRQQQELLERTFGGADRLTDGSTVESEQIKEEGK